MDKLDGKNASEQAVVAQALKRKTLGSVEGGQDREQIMERLNGVTVEGSTVHTPRDLFVFLDQDSVDCLYEGRFAARKKRVLDADLAFEHVDANIVVFIDRDRESGGIDRSDGSDGAEDSLLPLSRAGVEVDAHATGKDVEQVSGGGSVLAEDNAAIGIDLEIASPLHFEVGKAVASGLNEALDRNLLPGANSPRTLIALNRDLALCGGDIGLCSGGRGPVNGGVLRPKNRAESRYQEASGGELQH